MASFSTRTKFVVTTLSLTTLMVSYTQPAQALQVKYGAKCSKSGKISTIASGKLICTKVGSKLLWKKYTKISSETKVNTKLNPLTSNPIKAEPTLNVVVESAPSSAPSSRTSTLPILDKPIALIASSNSTTNPAPGRFCLDQFNRVSFNNEVLICLNGVWARQLGLRLNTKTSTYAQVNSKLIKSEKDIETALLKDWANWRNKKVLDLEPSMDVILQAGYSQDWAEVTKSTINYTSSVLNANSLKLVQKPHWVYTESEEERAQEYNTFMKNSSCKTNYVPNSTSFITMYCATADIGSGGVRIGKPNQSMVNGYKLTPRDKTILTYAVSHDLAIFYIVQTQYKDVAYTGAMSQIPAWIREGTAQLIGSLITNDLINYSKSYVDLPQKDQWVGPKPESICSRDLQDAEGKDKIMPDNCSQAMHLYAVSLLAANHGGIQALFDFFKLYGDNSDWVSDFQKTFNITREEFYQEWWTYLGVPINQWPDMLAPTPPENY